MGFKIRPHIFRTDEVVTNERVLENIRSLANEINGNLDRENIPTSAVSTSMIKDEAFNSVVLKESDANFTITGGGFQELDSTISENQLLNEDAMVITHFGCWYEWDEKRTELMALIDDENPGFGSSLNVSNRYRDDESKSQDDSVDDGTDDWKVMKEFFIDFEIRINGLVVCKNEFNSFFRKRFHVSMVGTAPVPAGELDIKVFARLRRNVFGKFQDVDAFEVIVKARSLVIEIKRR